MSYRRTLNTAVRSIEKAQTEFTPEIMGILPGSYREAATISSLQLAADILGLIKGD